MLKPLTEWITINCGTFFSLIDYYQISTLYVGSLVIALFERVYANLRVLVYPSPSPLVTVSFVSCVCGGGTY